MRLIYRTGTNRLILVGGLVSGGASAALSKRGRENGRETAVATVNGVGSEQKGLLP